MKVELLKLDSFRNYNHQKLDFKPDINILIGENGQGKTNLLEAISLICGIGSHRDARDQDMVMWGRDSYKIFAQGKSSGREGIQAELIFKNGKKEPKINNQKLRRVIELSEVFISIVFSPEELALVKGSPDDRRRFLDRLLINLSLSYGYLLSRYQKVLSQRNSLLKQIREGQASVKELELWDQQLAPLAVDILKKRIETISRLAPAARQIYKGLSYQREQMDLTYKSSIKLPLDAPDKWLELIFEYYLKTRQEELARGTTLIGPHRDDLQLYLNNREAKIFGSQGQQRSTALALKLAEIDMVYEVRNEYPIVLLDDVMSELDNSRRMGLMGILGDRNIQTFITTTNLHSFSKELLEQSGVFTVKEGSVISQKA